MHVEDVVACGEFGLEDLDVGLFAHRAGCGDGAGAEHVVEGMGVELFEVDIWIDYLFAHGIGHTDQFDAVFGALFRSDVTVGV